MELELKSSIRDVETYIKKKCLHQYDFNIFIGYLLKFTNPSQCIEFIRDMCKKGTKLNISLSMILEIYNGQIPLELIISSLRLVYDTLISPEYIKFEVTSDLITKIQRPSNMICIAQHILEKQLEVNPLFLSKVISSIHPRWILFTAPLKRETTQWLQIDLSVRTWWSTHPNYSQLIWYNGPELFEMFEDGERFLKFIKESKNNASFLNSPSLQQSPNWSDLLFHFLKTNPDEESDQELFEQLTEERKIELLYKYQYKQEYFDTISNETKQQFIESSMKIIIRHKQILDLQLPSEWKELKWLKEELTNCDELRLGKASNEEDLILMYAILNPNGLIQLPDEEQIAEVIRYPFQNVVEQQMIRLSKQIKSSTHEGLPELFTQIEYQLSKKEINGKKFKWICSLFKERTVDLMCNLIDLTY